MPQVELKKVFGLELQSNSFNVREGSLERAKNIVISQDNILTKRRGFKIFYEPARTVLNLTEYQSKLVGFCTDKVQIYQQLPNGDFTALTELDGETVSIDSYEKARNVQSNNNLYFTTNNGILKLESTQADVLKAGVKRALDLSLVNQDFSSTESYFTPDSQIGYRIVFGRRDANNNLVLGAPSELLTISNSVEDNSGSVSESLGVVTFTSGSSHGLTAGDYIYIKNSDGTGLPDGVYQTQAGTTGTTIKVTAIGAYSTITSLQWGKFYNNRIEFTIPSGLTTENIVQIYRSSPSATEDVNVDESTLQLIDEYNLESGSVSVGFDTYTDIIPDILRGAIS